MRCTSISCTAVVWVYEIKEPRINANRIFLAPSCSAPADRLRRNRTSSGKMLMEKPACGFFCSFIIFSITQKEGGKERKTGTPVFQTAFFQTTCDSCAGDQPERSTTAQEKCDSR